MNSSSFEPIQLWATISQFNYTLHEEVLRVFILNLLPGRFLWSCPVSCCEKSNFSFPHDSVRTFAIFTFVIFLQLCPCQRMFYVCLKPLPARNPVNILF